VLAADGHRVESLRATFRRARRGDGRPILIVARTVKGKGVSFMEGRHEWHGKPLGPDDYRRALAELGGRGRVP